MYGTAHGMRYHKATHQWSINGNLLVNLKINRQSLPPDLKAEQRRCLSRLHCILKVTQHATLDTRSKLEPKCDGDSSENVKQAIGLISKTTTLHVQHTFFVHFFASPHDYGMKIPMEDVNKRQRIFLSLSKLECGPREINSREIRLHLTFPAIWNNATKFEKTRIHFKSDVFAAELPIGQCFYLS